jgi:manganese/zinc/iron transport system permease protein
MLSVVLASLDWRPMDTWILIVGALCAMSCALPGAFLVLRKMSLMGDAISHAVLPGLAVAFLVTGTRDSLVMLAGAGLVGVLTAALVHWIHAAGKVDQGAAMGVVFSVLFALGLILIRQSADRVDLDPDCVLYGAIELSPLDQTRVLGWEVPRAALTLGGTFVLNGLFVLLLYKELKITAFDPALATALGINARLMHYLLMIIVAITAVAAFESVGSILVIAMLIVPPAAAYLLTDRLGLMLLLSLFLAALSAGLGHLAAITAPGWFGFAGVSTSAAGMMAAAAGVLFLLAMLFGPRHGAISKLLHRAALAVRIVREDLLGLLFRQQRPGEPEAVAVGVSDPGQAVGAGRLVTRLALRSLRRAGQLVREGGLYRLTAAGRVAAQQLVRSHRLWEAYFEQHAQLPADHLHQPAEQLEHVTGPALRERLAESLGHPPRDPHGTSIPPEA